MSDKSKLQIDILPILECHRDNIQKLNSLFEAVRERIVAVSTRPEYDGEDVDLIIESLVSIGSDVSREMTDDIYTDIYSFKEGIS